MRISLVGSSYKGLSVALDSQRSINLMEEFADSKDAAAPSALMATPGLGKLSALGAGVIAFGGFPVRGLFPIVTSAGVGFFSSLLVVAGNTLSRLDPDTASLLASEAVLYTNTTVGAIETEAGGFGSVPTHITFAASSTAVLFTGSQGHAYLYTIASGALSGAVVLDGVAGAYFPIGDCAWLAGYFLATVNSGASNARSIFYSPDGTTWASADFFTPEETPTAIKKLMTKNGHLWVFTDEMVIPYAPTGDGNNPFAAVLGGVISRGCIKNRSVCELNEAFYWLGSDSNHGGLIVYRSNGAGAERVSNAFAEFRMQQIFEEHGFIGIDDLICSVAVEHGHSLYKMHFHRGKTTLVYDVNTNKWHERGWWNPKTGEYEEEIGWIAASFNGMNVVADRRYTLDENLTGVYRSSESLTANDIFYQDAYAHAAGTDTFIRRERISGIYSAPSGKRLFCDSVELIFENGYADANGQGADPKVTLYVSHDGANTWGNGITRSIGRIGQYANRCLFSGLGSGYRLAFKIVMTDPIGWKLIDAIANMKAVA